MKKQVLLICVISFTLFFCEMPVHAQNPSSSISPSLSILNGAWQRISVKADGKMETNNRVDQFRVYHDGFYSSVGRDDSRAWKVTFGGTYEISNNIWKEKILYCSDPDLIGAIHWQQFALRGDTLILQYFKKLINPKGEDITATQPNKREATWVRVK